jgi:hypothetical protein
VPVALRQCPVCDEPMVIRELHCPACDITVRGEFLPGTAGPFSQLNDEQLAFLHLFVTSRGNMSDVERSLGVSYPTVRAKLDDLIGALSSSTAQAPPRPEHPDAAPQPPVPGPEPHPPVPAPAGQKAPGSSRREILALISDGSISVEEGMERMKRLPEE